MNKKETFLFFKNYFYAKDMDSIGQKICTEYFQQIWTLTSSEVC